jgi:hypothetical protein
MKPEWPSAKFLAGSVGEAGGRHFGLRECDGWRLPTGVWRLVTTP